MSKINQIQNALIELEGGIFQKLCDAYLKSKGFDAINSLGSVIGVNKTKTGTPDTFIRQKDGKLIFAEYTSTKSAIISKFIDDFKKCLDEEKTGVAKSEISQIIFCHNSSLDVNEENKLVQLAKKSGIIATVYGLEPISYDLYIEFPGLARDFLGIEIDTGQILSPDDFINNYDKNQLTTPLNTEFQLRSDEVKQALEHLTSNDLLILSGPAGVGKSRIALEIICQYQAQLTDAQAFCIMNKGQDLFEDIKVYFSKNGYFIILVDDANRTTGFEYIIDFLQNKRPQQNIKIIATVRDYAIDKVKDIAGKIGLVPELVIKPFEKEQIHKLIENLFQITNSLWLERISELASGNPRLAIMAAILAKQKGNIDSINDASALYDHYFSSLRKDIDALNDKNVLKTAGIISFFGSIDKSHKDLMKQISEIFEISQSEFWNACTELHEFELVDLYENEVVKISDQVIATYFFYLCFFKKEILSFDKLLHYFFPSHTEKIKDALYPCLNAFDYEEISQKISPPAKQALEKFQKDGEVALVEKLFTLLWFILSTDALHYINDKIAYFEQECISLKDISWDKPNTNVAKNNIIDLLKLFTNSPSNEFKVAVDLACKFACKRPSQISDIIYMFTETYGFKRHSHCYGYEKQTILMDILIEKTEKGKNELLSRLFLAVSKYQLHTQFDEHVSHKHSITIYKFYLLANSIIKKYRSKIWKLVFSLLKYEYLENAIFDVLRHYSSSGYYVNIKELQQLDAKIVIPQLVASLEPSKFSHGLIIEKFLKSISHIEIEGKQELSEKCNSTIMELYRLLNFEFMDIKSENYDSFTQIKQNKISEYSEDFQFDNYQKFFSQYLEIIDSLDENNLYRFKYALDCFFIALAERDGCLFKEVISYFLSKAGRFEQEVNPYCIIQNLFTFCTADEIIKIISGDGTENRFFWKLTYYEAFPEDMINPSDVDDFYNLMSNKKCPHTIYRWDSFKKYSALDSCFYVKLTNIINDRMKEGSLSGDPYGELFNSLSDTCKEITNIFVDDVVIIKEAYLLHNKADRNGDYDGAVMNKILDLDASFLVEYFSSLIVEKEYLSRFDDNRNYSFLWLRKNATDLINTLLERIINLINLDDGSKYKYDGFICCLFITDEHKKPEKEVINGQDIFLESVIRNEPNNDKKIELIFTAISDFQEERRLKFIAMFLKINSNFELFQKLELDPNHHSWSGSAVPEFSRRRNFWKSISAMCNTVELLNHKKMCEEIIREYNHRIESEKKRDFIGA